MIGHRTRVAQLRPSAWHAGEDESLERYVQASAAMDRAAVALLAVVPRGWILVGLVGLAPVFVSGSAGASAPALAIGLGGILLGFKAFHRLTAGIWSLAGAAIAWRQTAPVFQAASRRPPDRGSLRADRRRRHRSRSRQPTCDSRTPDAVSPSSVDAASPCRRESA